MMSFNTIRKQTQDIISFGIGARLLNFLAAFYRIWKLNKLYGFLTWAEIDMKGVEALHGRDRNVLDPGPFDRQLR